MQQRLASFGGEEAEPAWLGEDAAAAALWTADPVLRPIIRSAGPVQLRLVQDPWQALVRAVLFQQISGATAARICRQIETRIGLPSPSELLAMKEGALREFGVPPHKEATLRRLAGALQEGTMDLAAVAEASDDEAVALLSRYVGVGPWTSRMFLVFHLGREDVLLSGDLGLRRAAVTLYGLEAPLSPRDLEAHAKRWAPYRTAASWYLWRSLPNFPEPGLY